MKNVTIGNQQATEAELGWLAGILDGEGHIGLSRQNSKKARSIRPDVQIVNCDWEIIEKVRMICLKIGINPYIRTRCHDKKTWRVNYILTIGRFTDIKKLLDTVSCYLTGVTKSKSQLVINLINSRILKTRFDRYTDEELSMIDRFMAYRDASKSSTTIRKTHPFGDSEDIVCSA